MSLRTVPALIQVFLLISRISPAVLGAVLTGVDSESGFKDFGKSQSIFIAAFCRDVPDRIIGLGQKLRGPSHPGLDQILLRRHPGLLLHQLHKVTSRDAYMIRKLLNA